MNHVDELLHEAGGRWRASQPPPPSIDVTTLLDRREPPRPGWSLVAVGTSAVVVLVAGTALLQQPAPENGGRPILAPSPEPSGARPGPSSSTATPSPSGSQAVCDLTLPEPPFVPPASFSGRPDPNADWFGSADLWVLLDRDGERWHRAIDPPRTIGEKTFWWSADWSPEEEPAPAITVTGAQLDGPGAFSFGPGTNASASFGTAMLVGVDVPTPGCWLITGNYRDAQLSYVVEAVD
jgi:hypothetical protein